MLQACGIPPQGIPRVIEPIRIASIATALMGSWNSRDLSRPSEMQASFLSVTVNQT